MAEVSPLSVPGLHSGAPGALTSGSGNGAFFPQTDASGVGGLGLGPAEGAALKSGSPMLAGSLPGRLAPSWRLAPCSLPGPPGVSSNLHRMCKVGKLRKRTVIELS